MPPKSITAPSIHINHYSRANRTLWSTAKPVFRTRHTVSLPAGGQLPAPSADGLDVHGLACLLRHAYGVQQVADQPRTIPPTGGGLASPEAYLVVHRVKDMEPGLYRYRPHEHALEVLHDLDRAPFLCVAGAADDDDAQCHLVGVCALQRVASKYGEMAFKHTNLDAGVAQRYVELVAQRLDTPVRLLPGYHPRALMEMLRIPFEEGRYFATHVMALGAAPAPQEPHNELSQLFCVRANLSADQFAPLEDPRAAARAQWPLEQILCERRATRRFLPAPMDSNGLEQLLKDCWTQIRLDRVQFAADARLRLWVILPHGGSRHQAGLYRVDETTGLTLVAALRPEEVRRFSNQNSVVDASALVIASADLPSAFASLGPRAYRLGFQCAGRVLSDLWLNVCACGLKGTIVGGVMDEGLMHHGGTDGYSDTALAMFVFGQADLSGMEEAARD
jgi:SagB-type dehydrogenase family enzyme